MMIVARHKDSGLVMATTRLGTGVINGTVAHVKSDDIFDRVVVCPPTMNTEEFQRLVNEPGWHFVDVGMVLTLKQATTYLYDRTRLEMSRSMWQKWIDGGKLPYSYKVTGSGPGGRWMIAQRDLESLIAGRSETKHCPRCGHTPVPTRCPECNWGYP